MPNKLDLKGKKFNKLTVLNEVQRRTKVGQVKWICQCDCGVIKEIEATYIKRNRIKSCGCSQGPNKLPFGEAALNGLLQNIRLGAIRRNHIFTLKRKQMIEIINQNCYYCNIKPSNKYKHGHSFGYYLYNGIDRVNNEKGYTIKNVVACCKNCNYMKHKMNLDTFYNQVKNIYNNRIKEE